MANPDQQQSLNGLLKWGIENSAAAAESDSSAAPRDASKGLDSKMLAELLGGPSDADLMRASMTAIVAPISEVDLEQKMVAWDNFEQLIEQLDNANNIEALGLWAPLIQQLDNEEAEMRRMAAWCCSTAVQNNVKSQEACLAAGALPKLAKLAQEDPDKAVRKKAISALSSEVRNFQPGMDELAKHLKDCKAVDATDMDAVSEIIDKLRSEAASS
ncbi:hsp70 nucleotide exchange factor fes1 [Acrodontium crateriforme]|uniref:Hsp70 nucleotide exchange factor fes1 n=1 Tax=Acrodontium crateriforme TaxID=150365 RepID=A0AAQ3M3M1_9PEZI|nr:hsp70 nucleotide exchange factor fes1 [Acrodontium crateriforme]